MASQRILIAAHSHSFPSPQSFPWTLEALARVLWPLCAHPGPPVPASAALGLPLFYKNGGTNPARSIAPSAYPLRMRKGRSAESCAVDRPTRPRPTRHLTYWHLQEVRLPPLTLSPTRQHRRQEASVSQINVTTRRAALALELHGSGVSLAPPLPGPYGVSAPARRVRLP